MLPMNCLENIIIIQYLLIPLIVIQGYTLTGPDGSYKYTRDLMRLTTHTRGRAAGDPRYARITSPLRLDSWYASLRRHPDQDFVQYILGGITEGFQIGVDETRLFRSASQNMLSARVNAAVVEKYLTKESEAGNILGPFTEEMAPKVHISQFGTIPKKHQSGQFRLITDLSSPEGFSVNDAIDVFSLIHLGRRCSKDSSCSRTGGLNSQDRH